MTDAFLEFAGLRVALVHDWLYTVGGAERVLGAMLRCFPGADVHCLFDTLPPADRMRIGYATSRTTFLQRLPGIRRRHRAYLPLMPLAIEQLDLGAYDLVISSSFVVAKGVLTGPDQLHLAYVHSPMRYAWDLQHEYLRRSGVARGLKGAYARMLLHYMRLWDTRTASGPDALVANSHFVARRMRKAYGRPAEVIHPPVSVPAIHRPKRKGDHFLTASRLVPYKNTHAIVGAFRELPGEKLVVAGDGPEMARLRAMAGPNVEFVGHCDDAELRRLMGSARAFVFAAEEDFGIVPVEAQGEGTPVIALGRGGVCETVVEHGEGATGLFFDRPEAEDVADAIRRFVAIEPSFRPEDCHRNAQRFSEERFAEAFTAFVRDELSAFREGIARNRPRPTLRQDYAHAPSQTPAEVF